MFNNPARGLNLTSQQEAGLGFAFDQDPDLWLILLSHLVNVEGAAEALKRGVVENSPVWQEVLRAGKEKGLGALKELACKQPTRWNETLLQLLQDPGQVELLLFYLRTLVGLRTKRVPQPAPRIRPQQHINQLISSLANRAYADLEHYAEAARRLESGKTASGLSLSAKASEYYRTSYENHFKQVSSLLAIILIFKTASSGADVEGLRTFIQRSIIRPLEVKVVLLRGEEKMEQTAILENYYHLLKDINLAFDSPATD